MALWIIDSPSIGGKTDDINGSIVTADDPVFMLGHQNGSFPELDWHIIGEMGGIWNHPIKLMDGFDIELNEGQTSYKQDVASLENVPVADKQPSIRYKHRKRKPQLVIGQTQNWDLEVLFDRELGRGTETCEGTHIDRDKVGDHIICSSENSLEIKVFG